MMRPRHAGRTLLVKLPVTDLERSKAFLLPIADPSTHTMASYCLSVSSRDEVDRIGAAALAVGGSEADDAEDHGFMYSRGFFDLDGHGWQVMWMAPATVQPAERIAQ